MQYLWSSSLVYKQAAVLWERDKAPPIFSLHPAFPLWPLREQEPLSELFIQSLSPEALTDCCKPSCLPQNLPRPRCACQEKLRCLEPSLGPLFSFTASWVPGEFDFRTFYIKPRFAFVLVVLNISSLFLLLQSSLIPSRVRTKRRKTLWMAEFSGGHWVRGRHFFSVQTSVIWRLKLIESVCSYQVCYWCHLSRWQYDNSLLYRSPPLEGERDTVGDDLLCEKMSCFTFESLDAERSGRSFERDSPSVARANGDGGLTGEPRDLGPFL